VRRFSGASPHLRGDTSNPVTVDHGIDPERHAAVLGIIMIADE
jgi:hypothetical protein